MGAGRRAGAGVVAIAVLIGGIAAATVANAANANPCNADGKMNLADDYAATRVVNAGCPLIKVRGEFASAPGGTYYLNRTKSSPVSGAQYSTYNTSGEVYRWRGCSTLTSGATDCTLYSQWYLSTAWYTYPGL